MQTALHVSTQVLPGHRIEFDAPDVAEGTDVEVFVVVRAVSAKPKISVLELLKSAPKPGLFSTAEEADKYLENERQSW